MKYSEIKEYQKTYSEGEYRFPEFEEEDRIGTLQSTLGLLGIYEKVIGPEIFIGVGQDSKNILSKLFLRKMTDPYVMAQYAKSEKPGLKIMSNLFAWLLDNSEYKIFSDYKMTDAGEKLWQGFKAKLPKRIKIANLKTGEDFSIDDIGNEKSSDGELVTDPEKDTRDLEKQKWFYLLEGNFGKTLEENNSKFGSPIGTVNYRHRNMPKTGPVAPPNIFGPDD